MSQLDKVIHKINLFDILFAVYKHVSTVQYCQLDCKQNIRVMGKEIPVNEMYIRRQTPRRCCSLHNILLFIANHYSMYFSYILFILQTFTVLLYYFCYIHITYYFISKIRKKNLIFEYYIYRAPVMPNQINCR